MIKIVLVVLLVLGASYPVFAGGYAQEKAAVAAEQPKELVLVGNKICPVSGEKVGRTPITAAQVLGVAGRTL